MKVFLFIWITLLLLPFGLHSQEVTRSSTGIDYHYEQYRKTFESELNAPGTPADEEAAIIPAGISAVPESLLLPFSASPSTILVPGISDPGIDSATARSQAIFRALYLGSLMNGSRLSNLVDNFSQDFEDEKEGFSKQYIDYFEFTSQAPCGINDAKVVRESYSGFGECAVIVEYPVSPDPGKAMSFRTVGMVTEFEKDGVFECNSRIEFDGGSISTPGAENFKYICRSVNDLSEIESYYQDMLLPSSTAKLKYKMRDSTGRSGPVTGSRTDRGLWNALLASVIKAVTLEIRTQPSLFKSSSDNYSGKSRTLNRESITGNLSFRLEQVYFSDNKLWAILNQFKFSQP